MDENIDRAHIAWPIVDRKDLQAPSVFRPETLLREARRQRRLPLVALPKICILDPDGDVVRHVKRTGAGPHVEEIIGAQASIALHRGAAWTPDAPIARPRRRSSGRANWAHSPSPDLWKTQITKEHCKVAWPRFCHPRRVDY